MDKDRSLPECTEVTEAVHRLVKAAVAMNLALAYNGETTSVDVLVRPVLERIKQVLRLRADNPGTAYQGVDGKTLAPTGVHDVPDGADWDDFLRELTFSLPEDVGQVLTWAVHDALTLRRTRLGEHHESGGSQGDAADRRVVKAYMDVADRLGLPIG